MNSDSSYNSITSRLRQHKRRRDPTTCVAFDVAQIVPERPLPGWIRQRTRGTRSGRKSAVNPPNESTPTGEMEKAGLSLAIKATTNMMVLDLNNMRKDWKSVSTRRVESVQRARISQNSRAEPVRQFPGEVRSSRTPTDSPIAPFAQSSIAGEIQKDRREPAATDREVELEECRGADERNREVSPLLMKNTYLTLDQSKLPLEVICG